MAGLKKCRSVTWFPGTWCELAAGDMIPADVRLLSCKDLFLIQASLTGESFPVEKFAAREEAAGRSPLELTNVCYLGTSVESGAATAVVVATGLTTFLGGMSSAIVDQQTPTSFDRGVSRFTWLMIYFILVMVPLVFVINGLTKGDWAEAFFFALAVAVGLTPEMLPMIVAVCLSKGAHGHVPQESHRQTAELDPEPRCHGCSLHGQDRHAHQGPDHPGEVLRRDRSSRTTRYWYSPISTATSRPA